MTDVSLSPSKIYNCVPHCARCKNITPVHRFNAFYFFFLLFASRCRLSARPSVALTDHPITALFFIFLISAPPYLFQGVAAQTRKANTASRVRAQNSRGTEPQITPVCVCVCVCVFVCVCACVHVCVCLWGQKQTQHMNWWRWRYKWRRRWR